MPGKHSRRWVRGGVALGVLAVAGATTAATVAYGGTSQHTPARSTLPPATAQIARQTLLDQQQEDGTLAYGRESSIANRLSGTITALADIGAVVHRGESLYRVDNGPVVLLYGTLPMYRALAPGDEGADVKQFEQELRKLGYKGFTVDTKYDSKTAAAVKKWQKKLGLTQTGTVELGRIVYTVNAVRIATQKVEPGVPAQPGEAVLSTTGTAHVVTVDLAVSDQRLAVKGATVDVALPDNSRVKGTIAKVATVIDTSDSKNPKTEIEVTITLATAGATDNATVKVNFTAAEHKDVLTVPVAALLALAEGGYGVQVVQNGTTRIVAVQTGLYSGGRVEITGSGLEPGMTVGMPT
jgi:peptidoglycan hydrolase-like protein with peptidoglycan-binding domain